MSEVVVVMTLFGEVSLPSAETDRDWGETVSCTASTFAVRRADRERLRFHQDRVTVTDDKRSE